MNFQQEGYTMFILVALVTVFVLGSPAQAQAWPIFVAAATFLLPVGAPLLAIDFVAGAFLVGTAIGGTYIARRITRRDKQ